MNRPLNPVGYDVVSIGFFVGNYSGLLWASRVERNTTLYDGKPWGSSFHVEHKEDFRVMQFREHVLEYAALLEQA